MINCFGSVEYSTEVIYSQKISNDIKYNVKSTRYERLFTICQHAYLEPTKDAILTKMQCKIPGAAL